MLTSDQNLIDEARHELVPISPGKAWITLHPSASFAAAPHARKEMAQRKDTRREAGVVPRDLMLNVTALA